MSSFERAARLDVFEQNLGHMRPGALPGASDSPTHPSIPDARPREKLLIPCSWDDRGPRREGGHGLLYHSHLEAPAALSQAP